MFLVALSIQQNFTVLSYCHTKDNNKKNSPLTCYNVAASQHSRRRKSTKIRADNLEEEREVEAGVGVGGMGQRKEGIGERKG